MRLELGIAALFTLVSACELQDDLTFDIDISPECSDPRIRVVADPLLPGDSVLAAVHDGPASDEGWALVRHPPTLVRYPDGQRIELPAADAIEPGATHLVAGQEPGTVWVIHHEHTIVRVWRISAARIESMVVNAVEVPRDHLVRIAIMDDVPHLVAIPTESEDATTRLRVLALGEALEVNHIYQWEFSPSCGSRIDPRQCEALHESRAHPSIRLVASSPGTRRAAPRLFAQRAVSEQGQPTAAEEMVAISLPRTREDPPATLRILTTLIQLRGPTDVAADGLATYFLHMAGNGSLLWKFPAASNEPEFWSAELPLLDQAMLVPLASGIAVGTFRHDDGDDPSWALHLVRDRMMQPTPTAVYDGDFEHMEHAGPDAVLLRRNQAEPALLQVVCDPRGP